MTETRDLFLKKLYRKLKWQMTLKETQEIVHAYAEGFDKACALGQSEREICAALGTPTQLAATIIRVQPQQDHRPLRYKILFLVGLALLLFFPVLSLQGVVFRALWPLQEGLLYLYIPLMPLASIALFRLQHTWEIPFKKTPMTTRMCYGMAVLALLFCAVGTFAIYSVIVHPSQIGVHPSQVGHILYTFFTGSIWLITGLWVCSAVFCNACGRYIPYIYFIDAFCIATLSNYVQRITAMDPSASQTVAIVLTSAFGPIPIFALLAIAGALLWLVYVRHEKRRGFSR